MSRIPDDDLLDDLIAGRLILGRWPSCDQYQVYSDHNHATVLDHFGSWDSAIERAKDRWESTRDEWLPLVEGTEIDAPA